MADSRVTHVPVSVRYDSLFQLQLDQYNKMTGVLSGDRPSPKPQCNAITTNYAACTTAAGLAGWPNSCNKLLIRKIKVECSKDFWMHESIS